MSDTTFSQSFGFLPPPGVPASDIDLFDPDVLRDPAPTFRTLRDLGDVVWLSRLGMFAAGRFADVQSALRAGDVLISSEGVTANEALLGENVAKNPTGVLTTDGQLHDDLKRLLMKPLTPRALQDLREQIRQEAASAVAALATGKEFEAMSTLASHLPTRIVADLVGLNQIGHEQLLSWASAAFQAFGPIDNARTTDALPPLAEFVAYARGLSRADVVPGGWADGVFAVAENGQISLEVARSMVFDYATPSLDTTIAATGEMLWRLATEDGAFETVKARPELIPGVVNESVRLATPIRGFTRLVASDFALSETVLPAGSRVFLLYASANRDERHYPDPDAFDLTRNPRDHLGWGYGAHYCAGVHLARLEMETLLTELVRQVRSIECGTPTRLVSNGLQGFAKLPLVLHPA